MKIAMSVFVAALALGGCVSQEKPRLAAAPMTPCQAVAAIISSHYATFAQQMVAMEVGRNKGCFGQPQQVAAVAAPAPAAPVESAQDRDYREKLAYVQAFASTHPRFDELANDIAEILRLRITDDLATAYAMAERARPVTKAY